MGTFKFQKGGYKLDISIWVQSDVSVYLCLQWPALIVPRLHYCLQYCKMHLQAHTQPHGYFF